MFDSNKPNSNWISSSRVCQCHHTKVLLLWCLFFFLFSDDSFSFLNIVHHMYPNMYQICLIILGIPLSLSLSCIAFSFCVLVSLPFTLYKLRRESNLPSINFFDTSCFLSQRKGCKLSYETFGIYGREFRREHYLFWCQRNLQ